MQTYCSRVGVWMRASPFSNKLIQNIDACTVHRVRLSDDSSSEIFVLYSSTMLELGSVLRRTDAMQTMRNRESGWSLKSSGTDVVLNAMTCSGHGRIQARRAITSGHTAGIARFRPKNKNTTGVKSIL